MTRSRLLAAAAALFLPAAAMAESIEGAVDFGGKAPTPGKLHREANPYCAKKTMTDPAVLVKNGKLENVWVHVTKGAKEKDYDKAGTALKAWVALSSHLDEFDPPKGDKDDWKKLTKQYAADVKSLAKAVDDKDDKAIGAGLKSINTSCKTCHSAHKGK